MRRCNHFLDEMYKVFPGLRHGEMFINDFMNEFTNAHGGLCDITENDEAYSIEIEVPGIVKKDIAITFQDNELTVTWERRRKTDEQPNPDFTRPDGKVNRTFPVKGADVENVSADLKNGILTIIVPKLPERKGRTINIK